MSNNIEEIANQTEELKNFFLIPKAIITFITIVIVCKYNIYCTVENSHSPVLAFLVSAIELCTLYQIYKDLAYMFWQILIKNLVELEEK